MGHCVRVFADELGVTGVATVFVFGETLVRNDFGEKVPCCFLTMPVLGPSVSGARITQYPCSSCSLPLFRLKNTLYCVGLIDHDSSIVSGIS